MKVLNLLKSIKNISHLTALACFPLLSVYGETTPQQIIEAYANDKTLCKASGNVLAYKNMEGKTIVLKSGTDFALANKDIEKDVKVVSLEKVLEYTTESTNEQINSPKNMKVFGDFCKNDNDDWYKYIASKDPYKKGNVDKLTVNADTPDTNIQLTLSNCSIANIRIDRNYWEKNSNKISYQYDKKVFSMDPLVYIQACYSYDLHFRLGNFRHTEIQVQALWGKYKSINPGKSRFPLHDSTLKNNIKNILPVALIDNGKNKKVNKNNEAPASDNNKIYSLFEACDACRQTEWLQTRKDIFMFKIADGQVTNLQGRYKVKDKEFMSQQELENIIKEVSEDKIGNELLKKDFEELK